LPINNILIFHIKNSPGFPGELLTWNKISPGQAYFWASAGAAALERLST